MASNVNTATLLIEIWQPLQHVTYILTLMSARVIFLSHFVSAIVFIGCLAMAGGASPRKETFISDGRKVTYEAFRSPGSPTRILILLPGASGPQAPFYREQATYFAEHSYRALLLHYFDVTNGPAKPTDSRYRSWSHAVINLANIVRENSPGARIGILGYSLGASIALASGAQNAKVAAIAEWYGSLPDEFLPGLRRLPTLLILHGAKDNIIPVMNAHQLEKLCMMRGFAYSAHIYDDQEHGFSDGALADADERTLKFLTKYLR